MESLKIGWYVIDDPCPYWTRGSCNIIEIIKIENNVVWYRYEDEQEKVRRRYLSLFETSTLNLIPLSKLTRELI